MKRILHVKDDVGIDGLRKAVAKAANFSYKGPLAPEIFDGPSGLMNGLN
jgi:hypothetical protein